VYRRQFTIWRPKVMDSLLRFVKCPKYHVRDKESSENQPLKFFSMSLLSRTPSPLNPYSVKDPLSSQPFWSHGPPSPIIPSGATDTLLSTFLVPRTPSILSPMVPRSPSHLNLSCATDPSLLTLMMPWTSTPLKLPGATQLLPKIISYTFTKQDID
jgi:hypothetical protein